MRRFIAFLILSISILLGIGFNAGNVLKNTNAGVDYDAGREFVYRITDEQDEDIVLDDKDIERVKDTLEDRLKDAGVDRYKIQIEGTDQIRVIVSKTTVTEYAYIQRLMSFNAKFELATTNDENFAPASEIFKDSTARMAFKTGNDSVLPYVAIKISDKGKIKDLADAALAITPKETNEEQGGTADENMLILWADKAEGDTYEFANSSEEGADKVKEKIFMKFDPNNLYFDEDTKDEIAVRINPIDSNQNEKIEDNEIKASVALARHYINLFNAGELDYHVEFLFDTPCNSLVENFINYGTIATVAGSRTFIAFIIGLALLVVFISYFYRYGGLASIVSTFTTLFFTFMLFNAVGLEFNIAAIVGLIVVTIVSTLSGIVYNEKLKEEAYKGRSLKKANSEAVKKSFLPIIDINVVLLIVGCITYFIGNAMIDSFAFIATVGSVLGFIVNVTIYRLLMWLVANNTAFQNKQRVLGIKEKFVPNLLNEEKQTYFGPFENRDFTKNTKKKSIIIASVTLACALFMGIIGVANGNVFSYAKDKDMTRVYYEIHEYSDKEDVFSTDYLKAQFEDKEIKVSNIEVYETKDDNEESVFYYVIDLKKVMNAETAVGEGTLEDFTSSLISNTDTKDRCDIRLVKSYGSQPDLGNILLTVGVATLVAVVYIAIRYNIAHALSTLVVTVSSTFLSLAFMSIANIPVVAPTMISVFVTSLLSMFICLLVAMKSKETIKDDKTGATVSALNIRSLSLAAGPIAVLGLIGAYLAIDFLGFGPLAYNTLFCAALIGVGVAIIFTLYIYIPLVNLLMKVIKPRHKKIKKQEEMKLGNIKSNKSSEPEESIFIGIND